MSAKIEKLICIAVYSSVVFLLLSEDSFVLVRPCMSLHEDVYYLYYLELKPLPVKEVLYFCL